MISFQDLEALLIRLVEKSEPDEGGVLIPFKKRLQNDSPDKKFMKRLLMSLDIPIYIGKDATSSDQSGSSSASQRQTSQSSSESS